MSAVVTIDLGEDWAAPEDPPARPRRRPPGAAMAALLVLVVLLVIGGSAPPRPPFALLADVPAQGVTATEVGGDAVFVATQSGGRRSIARYALDGGALTWQVSQAGQAGNLSYLPGAGVLIVWAEDYPAGGEQFAVLDAATGGQLWSSTDSLMVGGPPASPYMLVRTEDPDGSSRIRYVDMRDGRTIWSRPVPEMTQALATDGQTRPEAAGFVVGYADGTVLLLARETGEVLGTARLDRLVPISPGGALAPDNGALLTIVHGRLMVVRGIAGPTTTVSVYDLPGLTQRWTLSGQMPVYPEACGSHVCLSGNPSGVVALDPATGSTVWRAPGWVGAQDLSPGRLLGYRAGNAPGASILDAGTGRTIGALGDWTLLAGADSYLASRPDPGNFRNTWFGVLDPGHAVVRPLGRLAGLSTGGCEPHEDLLVCRTVDARLKVWRYRQ